MTASLMLLVYFLYFLTVVVVVVGLGGGDCIIALSVGVRGDVVVVVGRRKVCMAIKFLWGGVSFC